LDIQEIENLDFQLSKCLISNHDFGQINLKPKARTGNAKSIFLFFVRLNIVLELIMGC